MANLLVDSFSGSGVTADSGSTNGSLTNTLFGFGQAVITSGIQAYASSQAQERELEARKYAIDSNLRAERIDLEKYRTLLSSGQPQEQAKQNSLYIVLGVVFGALLLILVIIRR